MHQALEDDLVTRKCLLSGVFGDFSLQDFRCLNEMF